LILNKRRIQNQRFPVMRHTATCSQKVRGPFLLAAANCEIHRYSFIQPTSKPPSLPRENRKGNHAAGTADFPVFV